MKLKIMTQLTSFKTWWRTEYPPSLLPHLVNLKEFSYTDVPTNIKEKFLRGSLILLAIPRLPNLESLMLDTVTGFDPFDIVATPSKLTKFHASAPSRRHISENSAKLAQFSNLQILKLDINVAVDTSYFPALEQLELVSHEMYSLEHNINLTKLSIKCPSIDQNIQISMRQLTKIKRLEIQLTNTQNSTGIDSSFDYLYAMTRLEHFNISG